MSSDFRQRAERAHADRETKENERAKKGRQVAAEHLTTLLGTILGIDLPQPLDDNTYTYEGVRYQAAQERNEWVLTGALILSENGMRVGGTTKIESLADVGALYKNGSR
jgi:hypothetical protein